MNSPQTLPPAGPLLPPPRRRPWWRYALNGLLIFVVTFALLYVEENWRGRRAWENCKREMEAKGVRMDWSYYIPPPVPDDQNIFGVPEMQKWFVGRGKTELSEKLKYTGYDTPRMTVATLTIGLPGESAPAGATVLHWGDGNQAQAQAARLMTQVLRPFAWDPSGYTYTTEHLYGRGTAQIFLQCDKRPTDQQLDQFLEIFRSKFAAEAVKLENAGWNSYQVTMFAPMQAADYVAWWEKMEPDLAFLRPALQRPYARMDGNYHDSVEIPIPNFVTIRNLSQRLAALAECYMALGQPDEALDALTLMHQLCRVMEARPTGRPMTLVAAMINVAVSGLYADTIKDGMRLQLWKEPQLAALQEQFKEINLRPDVMQAFIHEQVGLASSLEKIPMSKLGVIFNMASYQSDLRPKFSPTILIPRGWVYQNLVVLVNLHQVLNEAMNPPSQLVEPHKIEAAIARVDQELSHKSPFKIIASIAIPNFSRAMATCALNQTKANQGQIVCALERYHLAHGEYPAALENLIPQFIDKIPADLIGGQPPHYHRTEDGKFVLYSIGWSEKDQGGKSGLTDKEGDWVWGDYDYH